MNLSIVTKPYPGHSGLIQTTIKASDEKILADLLEGFHEGFIIHQDGLEVVIIRKAKNETSNTIGEKHVTV